MKPLSPNDWYAIEIYFANLRAQRDLEQQELMAMMIRMRDATRAAYGKPARKHRQYWQKNHNEYHSPERAP